MLPDYHADRPRACMDGWARRYIVVTPDGTVLPCQQAAHASRASASKACAIGRWPTSGAIRRRSQAFRGEAWMPDAVPRAATSARVDFGGCRCQAFALAGDAAATDPACALAPRHDVVLAARMHAERPPAPAAPIRLRRFHPSRESG